MAGCEPIEDSLLQLLKCGVCLEEVERLKVLPCQHTTCLPCVRKLTKRNNRFKCPLCSKEIPVPNGGFEKLPDCLVTKQIADLIKQMRRVDSADEAKQTTAVSAEPSTETSEQVSTPRRPDGEGTAPPLITSGGGFGFVPSVGKKEVPKVVKAKSANSKTSHREKKRVGKDAAKEAGLEEETELTNQTPRSSANPAAVEESSDDVLAGSLEADTSKLQLRKELLRSLELGEKCSRKTDEMIEYYRRILEILPVTAQHTREAIIAYQEKIVRLCLEKLQGLDKGLADRTTELQASLKRSQPQADQLKDAIKKVPELKKKLLSKDCSEQCLAEVRQYLLDFNKLHSSMNKNSHEVEECQMIEVGESVRMNPFGENVAEKQTETLVNGRISHCSVGIFIGKLIETIPNPIIPWFPIELHKVMVIFPEQFDWTGPVASIGKSLTKASMPYLGDRVRVKASVQNPHFSWNGVRAKKSRGILKKVERGGPEGDLIIVVDFPEDKTWKGVYSEIELAPGCGLEIGDEVWVSRSIPEPSRGWADVNGSSVGKVKRITGAKGQEEVTVDFPECKDWIGLATELELVRVPQIGDKVQVKLSVKEPRLGWNGATHQEVGVLTEITDDFYTYGLVATVRFTRKPPWTGLMNELEPARYQPPSYGVTPDYDDDDYYHFDDYENDVDDFRSLLVANMLNRGAMF